MPPPCSAAEAEPDGAPLAASVVDVVEFAPLLLLLQAPHTANARMRAGITRAADLRVALVRAYADIMLGNCIVNSWRRSAV